MTRGDNTRLFAFFNLYNCDKHCIKNMASFHKLHILANVAKIKCLQIQDTLKHFANFELHVYWISVDIMKHCCKAKSDSQESCLCIPQTQVSLFIRIQNEPRVRLAKQETLTPLTPGLISGLQGSVNVHRGDLLLVPQWQCISSFVFYILRCICTPF